jgi:hypothetical protein
MIPKRDYSRYNTEKIYKQILINKNAPMYEYVPCVICEKLTPKLDERKVLCGDYNCRNVLAGLRKFNYLQKMDLRFNSEKVKTRKK